MWSPCYAQSAGEESPADVVLDPGSSIVLRAASSNAVAWQWYKDGDPITGALESKLRISQSGTYTVIAFNELSCPSPVSGALRVRIRAKQADLGISKNSEIKQVITGGNFEYVLEIRNKGPQTATQVEVTDSLPESLDFIRFTSAPSGVANYDASAKKILWKLDSLQKDMSERLRFEVKTNRKGQIRNTASVSAKEYDPVPADNAAHNEKNILGLQIPNVFTPDGDGKNDAFVVPGLQDYPDNEIVIINRWGNSVYEKHNYQNDWTGDGLNEGTYFYVLTVRNSQGYTDTYKGYITLLRSRKN